MCVFHNTSCPAAPLQLSTAPTALALQSHKMMWQESNSELFHEAPYPYTTEMLWVAFTSALRTHNIIPGTHMTSKTGILFHAYLSILVTQQRALYQSLEVSFLLSAFCPIVQGLIFTGNVFLSINTMFSYLAFR